jgi:DNA repair photolyase
MLQRAEFTPYRPKNILNKSQRADHWFWTRYSAYPYIGCQHGCEFCYCREQKYSPYDDPHDFAYRIKAKINAAELLRKGLQRVPVDMIFTGDYQPAERKYQLSRKMLEVCYELGFPVFILERSPLVLRDLDLIQAIHLKARAVVAFSIISVPGAPNYARITEMEHLAPPAAKRLAAMEKLAAAGIPTGVCAMPLLPGLCDQRENLLPLVKQVADNGGQFILASSLTLADQQRAFFLSVLEKRFPDLLVDFQRLYPASAYAPAAYDWKSVACLVRELCEQAGIRDRQPRPIIPGDKHGLNRRIVEQLAEKVYSLELEGAPNGLVWTYRKAAWAVEDLEQDIRLVLQVMGQKGLESISGIGVEMAGKIKQLAVELDQPGSQAGRLDGGEIDLFNA